MSSEAVLVVLNVLVAVAYVVGAWIFVASSLAMAREIRRSEIKPRWMTPMFIGGGLFLGGCGAHHLHLAIEIIPQSIHKFGERSLWLGQFWHHVFLEGVQIIGALLFFVPAFVMLRQLTREV